MWRRDKKLVHTGGALVKSAAKDGAMGLTLPAGGFAEYSSLFDVVQSIHALNALPIASVVRRYSAAGMAADFRVAEHKVTQDWCQLGSNDCTDPPKANNII
jgi:hypothetical protein